MNIYKPDLFNNPNITFKLKSELKNINQKSIKMLYYDITNDYDLTDEEMEQKILKSLRKFRYENVKNYDFVLTCPVCCEESNDINFLFGLTNCDHFCCYDCWEKHCRQIAEFSHNKPTCIGCAKEISFRHLYETFKIEHDILHDYNLKIYQRTYRDLIECPKCRYKFAFRNISKTTCPKCQYQICPKCLELSHIDELGIDCDEFAKFMKMSDYLKYFELKEEERLKQRYSQNFKNNLRDFEKELLIKVELKNKRNQERERQKKLLKFEKQNIDWIKEHTKSCPNCDNAIEKNKGCNHMTCKCGYEFCWYCLEECKKPCEHFKACKAGAKWFDDGYRDD